MRIFIEILTAYSIYVLGTAILIWRFSENGRVASTACAVLMPFMTLGAVVATFLSVMGIVKIRIKPCPPGLEQAELLVERHRKEMFGGKSVPPHLASEWTRVYRATLQIEAQRVKTFTRKFTQPATA
jgi:hypothetical protein